MFTFFEKQEKETHKKIKASCEVVSLEICALKRFLSDHKEKIKKEVPTPSKKKQTQVATDATDTFKQDQKEWGLNGIVN